MKPLWWENLPEALLVERFRYLGFFRMMTGNPQPSKVGRSMTFQGEFWSRKYESEIDVSAELQTSVTTPLASAFVDACMSVEEANLSAVTISVTADNGFQVEATGDLGKCAIFTKKCPKCSATIYKKAHPFNGCISIVVEEVMAT